MPEDPKSQNIATREELTISNIYEIEAVIELLEKIGPVTPHSLTGLFLEKDKNVKISDLRY